MSVNTNASQTWHAASSYFRSLCSAEDGESVRRRARENDSTAEHVQLPELHLIPDGWLSGRMLFWPTVPSRLWRISLVSSRLPERRDLCSWWYDALRTTCARCNPEREALLTVPGTTCFDAAVRASELFGIPRIEVHASDDQALNPESAVAWLNSKISASLDVMEGSALVTPVFLSPRVQPQAALEPATNAPLRDIISFAMADRLVLLHCRQGGNIWNLSKDHMRQSSPAIVIAAQTSRHQNDLQEIASHSVVPWLLFDDADPSQADQSASSGVDTTRKADWADSAWNESSSDPISNPGDWLCHWTRPFRSAWPDQSPDDFLDELILGCKSADRSALAALIRITDQKKVIATVARKEEQPTVSLTAVRLAEFRERRVFRMHRRRYDFEPYGIAVRKAALIQLGARPVQYVDHQPDADNDCVQQQFDETLFQQPRFDRNGKIDWSTEQEWRLPGDLDLSAIDPSAVVVFVNEETESARFPQSCKWKVITVPHPDGLD